MTKLAASPSIYPRKVAVALSDACRNVSLIAMSARLCVFFDYLPNVRPGRRGAPGAT